MLEVLKNIDTWLLMLINSAHHPFFDTLMWWISDKYVWIPMYLFLIFKMYQKFKFDIWKIIIVIAVTITLSDGISSGILKKQVKRYRPSHHIQLKESLHLHQYSDGTYYAGGKYGFVSSHAANSMAIAILVCLFLGGLSKSYYFLILWTFIVSYSRIYLGVHYPSDIIGGLLIGLFSAYISYWLGVKFLKIKDWSKKKSNFEV
jgi:undecaprenyl-diphosphatase